MLGFIARCVVRIGSLWHVFFRRDLLQDVLVRRMCLIVDAASRINNTITTIACTENLRKSTTTEQIPAKQARIKPWFVGQPHRGMEYLVTIHPLVLVMVPVAVQTIVSAIMNGWNWIVRSLIASVRETSNHPDICSGKGKCINHNECECNDGFRGHKCQRPAILG